jgi:hypothetical protein
MYPTSRYKQALVRLGGRVNEAQRMMLLAHARAPHRTMDVLSLARSAGQASATFTYSQYGRLGHLIATSIRHRRPVKIWTRLIGEDTRHVGHGRMQWRMHATLAAAVGAVYGDSLRREGESAVTELATVDATTREQLIAARLGQGIFRERLIVHWGACAVTGCDVLQALRASHIKPWKDCSNSERLDPGNGLLLLGTLDCLFDGGLITFDSKGSIRPSPLLTKAQRRALGLRHGMRLQKRLDETQEAFMKWHRQRVFLDALR